MKSIFLTQNGDAQKAFSIKENETPKLDKGEVLIKVRYFGLNYADVMARNGLYKSAPPLPSVLGYEVAGTIEAVAEDLDQNLIGQKVASFTRFGGYTEYAKANISALIFLDNENQLKDSLALITQGSTAYYCFEIAANFFKDDIVIIHAAAGGVGSILIQLAKKKGCFVIATCGSDEKVDFIKSLGADYVINYNKTDYQSEIETKFGQNKIRATFNPIGGSTFKKDFKLLEPSGAVILFGGSERSNKKWGLLSTLNFVRKMGLIIPIGLMMGSKSVIGVNMLNVGDYKINLLQLALNEILASYKKGEIKIHIGGVFKADAIGDAHELLESRKSIGKVVVEW